MKQPRSDLRVKFDLIPELGTKGRRTLGTFNVYCFASDPNSNEVAKTARKNIPARKSFARVLPTRSGCGLGNRKPHLILNTARN